LPPLFAALLLQAPLLVGLGFYALDLPLGHDPYPCFFWEGTDLEQLEAFAAVAALSAPLGLLLRLERGGLRPVQWLARRALPFAVLGAVALAALGAVRLARFPTPDRYVESLPLHTTIPSPRDQPCTRIEDKLDPKHAPEWRYEQCATPDFDARPFSFHYHAEATSEPSYYRLYYRTSDGHDHPSFVGLSRSKAAELPVRRDDSLKVLFVPGDRRLGVIASDGWRWKVSLLEVRKRIAPPRGWWWASLVGLAFALACLGASSALGEASSRGDEAREAWIAARRGELSLAALAVVACSSAPMLAALIAGFLT
jgi:hypothetical protein